MTLRIFRKYLLITKLLLLSSYLLPSIQAHAVMEVPAPRSSTINNCGSRGENSFDVFVGKEQPDDPGSNCGVCGDELKNRTYVFPAPRANEYGGKFGLLGTATVFKSGQLFNSLITVMYPHAGYMEWRLCEDGKFEITEKQKCFDKHVLEVVDAWPSQYTSVNPAKSKTKLFITTETRPYGNDLLVNAILRLPAGIICDRCVIQFNYRAPTRQGETFRSCAEVRIIPEAVFNSPSDLLENVGKSSPGVNKCLDIIWETFTLANCDKTNIYSGITSYQPWETYSSIGNSLIIWEWCLEGLGQDTAVKIKPCLSKHQERTNQKWLTKNVQKDKSFQLEVGTTGLCLSPGKDSIIETATCDVKNNGQFWKVRSHN